MGDCSEAKQSQQLQWVVVFSEVMLSHQQSPKEARFSAATKTASKRVLSSATLTRSQQLHPQADFSANSLHLPKLLQPEACSASLPLKPRLHQQEVCLARLPPQPRLLQQEASSVSQDQASLKVALSSATSLQEARAHCSLKTQPQPLADSSNQLSLPKHKVFRVASEAQASSARELPTKAQGAWSVVKDLDKGIYQ